MTSSVPRGEIHRTRSSLSSRANASPAPTVPSNPRPAPAAAVRLTSSRLVNPSRRTSSGAKSSSICLLLPSFVLRLPARPTLADEVEHDIDGYSKRRDDHDRRPDGRNLDQRREEHQLVAETALL